MKPQWIKHGTSVDIKKPGAFWQVGDHTIFTPAPFNCRRIALEETKLLAFGKSPKYKSYFV